ncbi:MAG: YmdB family metallophosphoesterase [Candidatus Krumholzibacteriota bacterium]|nr:YmdB family metallophosphoesterase [Candidatus Krumholzibacteriota bacterium]
MRLIFIADVFGRPGRRALARLLPGLRERHAPDLVVANAENSAGGAGFTRDTAEELLAAGVDLLTGGNHSWDNRDGAAYLETAERALRPDNFPPGVAGRGTAVLPLPGGRELLVVNLQGRVYLPAIDCPFRRADSILADWGGRGPVLVDFHAEATSEKTALAHHLDGRVTAVIGTHTHVQTADARILPGGTAFLTDAGMTGPHGGVIGITVETALHRFLRTTPRRFEVSQEAIRLQGALLDFDPDSWRALALERLDLPLED